jgi:hypothetical protein
MEIKLGFQKENNLHDLDLIREQLYSGAYLDIANITGYSESLVKKVICGVRKNPIVIEATKELIQEHREVLVKLETKYQELDKQQLTVNA